jgi:hypothetical protein
MRRPGPLFTFFLLIWFLLIVLVFVILTVPADGRMASTMPTLFWTLRDMIYPWFYSPSVM